MKILLTIIFLLLSTPCWAAYSFLAVTCGVSTNGTAVTTPSMNSTGATLIVLVNACNVASCSGSISDSSSNTYTYQTGNYSVTAGNNVEYVLNPTTSSSQTFTVTSQQDPSLCAIAFTGTSSTQDKANNNSASSSTTVTPGSVTPGASNEVLVTVLSNNVASTVLSIDSGFTIPSGGTGAFTSNGLGIGVAYLIQTTAGAVNPTWTSTLSGATTLSSSIITVKSGATAPMASINSATIKSTTVY